MLFFFVVPTQRSYKQMSVGTDLPIKFNALFYFVMNKTLKNFVFHLGQRLAPNPNTSIPHSVSTMASGVEVLTVIGPTSDWAANRQVHTRGHGPVTSKELNCLQTEGMEWVHQNWGYSSLSSRLLRFHWENNKLGPSGQQQRLQTATCHTGTDSQSLSWPLCSC